MERGSSNKRFYFGIILIVVGCIMILEKLNLIPESVSDLLISWQMLLVGIGVLSLIGGNRTGGTILIVIGGFFMIPELITVPHEIRKIYWPLMLVAIGVALLLRHRDSSRNLKESDPVLNVPNDNSANNFDDFVIFGGREIFINSQSLTGGKATSIFGGMEYDLRKAAMVPGGAVIDCVSVFGGCGFKIPMDWNVRNEVTTIFGAFTDKRGDTFNERYYDPSKTIVIKGVSIFGGIEVKHF
ncbi:MAG: cell wall-active antibiotics response protein [Prolixibacteraceae bacterium]|nr:cell wall-active antibiotics response protein [Prolixibacteraceae bacterium]